MKLKINKYIIIIGVFIILLTIIMSTKSLAIEDIKIEYEYIEDTNEVIAKIISNVELEDTKPTWSLSKDKKIYTKVYRNNTEYFTPVQDVNGKISNVFIEINQIQKAILKMNYYYDEEKNQVTAQIVSNIELKDTKPTWELSKDKKIYTKIFKENTQYSTPVQDKWGNIIDTNIVVVDVKGLEIKTEYEYVKETNEVISKMISNVKLKDTKPTWKLSDDKKVYTKIYTKNEKLYTTEFQDRYGNKTKANIQVVQVDDKGPQVTITTKYNSDKRSAVVTIVSNEELYNIDSTWTLANNKKTCEIKYKRNGTYNIVLQDKWGNKTNKIIKISGLIAKGIDVSQHNSRINWAEVQKEGIDFVILRLGWVGNKENHTLDTYFKENYESCVRLGIPVGVYVYSYCENEETVKSDAKWTAEQLKGKKITYPVFIDMEDSQIENLDVQTLTDISKTFCEELKTSGYSKVGIYANKNWLVNKLDVSQLSKYSIWLAHYTDKTDYSGKYDMWQYTSSGTVNGIIGNVDMNYSYKIY